MYDPAYELEHFGIPGMKWGVRRTPAQLGHRQEKKLNRYKEREIGKIKKRMASDEVEEGKRRKAYANSLADLKRQAKRERNNHDELIFETMMKQLYPTAKEQQKEMKEDDSFLREVFKIRRKEAKAEIEAVKNMSYKDMRGERVELGKRFIEDMSANVLSVGRVPLVKYDSSRVENIKTMRRLQQGRYAKKKPKVSKK